MREMNVYEHNDGLDTFHSTERRRAASSGVLMPFTKNRPKTVHLGFLHDVQSTNE
jgi:hypothetical protein